MLLDFPYAVKMMKKIVLISLVTLISIVGCSFKMPRIQIPQMTILDNNGWVADYESAEKRVKETGNPLLIYFQTGEYKIDQRYRRAIDHGRGSMISNQFVRCLLVNSYEPDRRYVQQFGVQRAPALILVHADGTYHAEVGLLNDVQIAQFVTKTTPPGHQPNYNSHIPRKPEYVWYDSLEKASAQAKKLNRPLFIVYERTFSDDNTKLKKLLSRREVYHRIDSMIHVRIPLTGLFAKAYISPFGALKLPAMVIAQPGGPYFTLELPTTYEQVVHFADQTLAAFAQTQPNENTVTTDLTP